MPVSTSAAAGLMIPGDPGGIRAAANTMRTQGEAFRTTGEEARTTWNGLQGAYQAPEAPTLIDKMTPVPQSAADRAMELNSAATALETFATKLEDLQSRAASLQAAAATFDGAGNDGGQGQAIQEAIAALMAEYLAAQQECAGAITGLVGGVQTFGFTGGGTELVAMLPYSAAGEAARLLGKLSDPTYRMTTEEMEALRNLLEVNASNPEFATELLTTIQPEGLLAATANAGFQAYNLDGTTNPGMMPLVGGVQGGLAVALATATQRGPGGMPLRTIQTWIDNLKNLGGKPAYPTENLPAPVLAERGGVSGFHSLGILISDPDANFDRRFLNQIGGAMLDFERANGGSGVWQPIQSSAHDRINWIVDSPDHPTGRDPIAGLMSALKHNPEAARQFLTNLPAITDPAQLPRGQRLDRIDYLLTDRDWPDAGPNERSQIRAFGEVLEQATLTDPAEPGDLRAARIMESLVLEPNLDEPFFKKHERFIPFLGDHEAFVSESDLVHPEMRPSVARILAGNLDSVWRAFSNHDVPTTTQPDFRDLTGGSATDLTQLLVDLGKDSEAYPTLAIANANQLGYELQAEIHAPELANDPHRLEIDAYANGAARTAATLRVGGELAYVETLEHPLDAIQRHGVTYVVGTLFDKTGAAISKVPGLKSLVTPAVEDFANALKPDHAVDVAKHKYRAQATDVDALQRFVDRMTEAGPDTDDPHAQETRKELRKLREQIRNWYDGQFYSTEDLILRPPVRQKPGG